MSINWEQRYAGLAFEHKQLSERVRQGALFEQQKPDYDHAVLCPECDTEMLVMDIIEEALCPDCHDLYSFSECKIRSSDTHEKRSK